MKASSIKGTPVVDLSCAQKVGNVSHLIIDPNERRVLALEVRGERFKAPQVVEIDKIRAFGRDAITIDDTSGLTELALLPSLSNKPTLDDFLGTKIVTTSGTVLGAIKDVGLSDDGRNITAYEFTTGGIGSVFGLGTKWLQAQPDQRWGGKLLTVPDSDAGEVESTEEQAEQRVTE